MARTGRVRSAEIEAIYRDRFPAFVLSATAILGDGEKALDAVQEGFARALHQRGSFRGDGALEGWVWRIVVNAARDRLRDDRRATSPRFREPSSDSFQPPEESLRSRVLALPERQRLAVFLRYYADLSYEEIADALVVRPGTVAASLHAALASLRSDLEEAKA
jgi:RNA polymerase sigma factor (sigma-70 family)